MASLGLIGMVGGIGGEMVKQADEERKTAAHRDFETWRMEVLQSYKIGDEARAEQRTIAGEKRKTQQADEAREARVKRIGAKAGEIADTQVGRKRGLVESGIADRSAWTEEQQATVDQSLALDRDVIAGDDRTIERAAIATGDIDPAKAAAINRDERRLDASEKATASKERQAEMRDATQRYIADLRHQDSQKRLDALIAKTGRDASGVKEALSVIDGSRKDLSNEATNLKALYATEIKDKSKSEQARIAAEYKPKFDAIDAQRQQLDADYDSLRGKVGLPPRKAPEPSPTPAPKPAPANRPPLSSFQRK